MLWDVTEAPLETAGEPLRRRGRPRADRSQDARGRILHAAEKEFAARGYEATSLRAIARRASVDPALVHHYFADKADLFAEVVSVPVRPDKAIKSLLAGPRDAIGEGIARYILGEFEKPAVRTRAVALIRSVIGTEATARFLKGFLVREVFHRIARALDVPDADLRANLAASQLLGMMVLRYVVAVEPIATAPVDELVARVGPAIQWHLTGYPGDPSPRAEKSA